MSQVVEALPAASPWVEKFGVKVLKGGKILDLACGSGRHSRWFLQRGYRVLAVDRDISKLRDLQAEENLEIMEYDLEADLWPFVGQKFDAIVVTNYLHRPLFPHLVHSLGPGGMLIYETFAIGNEKYGKPSNPNFLLRKGELFQYFSKLLLILEHEDFADTEQGPAVRQHLAGLNLTSVD